MARLLLPLLLLAAALGHRWWQPAERPPAPPAPEAPAAPTPPPAAPELAALLAVARETLPGFACTGPELLEGSGAAAAARRGLALWTGAPARGLTGLQVAASARTAGPGLVELRIRASGPPAAVLGWLETVLAVPVEAPGAPEIRHLRLTREGTADAAASLVVRIQDPRVLAPGGGAR